MNPQDPEYLNRVLKQINPDVLRAAEAMMLKGDIANLQRERDAAVASTLDAYDSQIVPLQARLAELERIHAGEQVKLFKVGPAPADLEIKCSPSVDATNGPVKECAFNEAMCYAAKNPASQEPIGAVIPCSTDEASKPVQRTDGFTSTFNALSDWLDNNPEAMYHTPKNAQVVTRDGQTFFVFKSAGYKAIAERLGFPYRPMMDGYKRFLLTPKEYNDVFVEHKKMAVQREGG